MNKPLNKEQRLAIRMAVSKISRIQKFGDLYNANMGCDDGISFRKVDLSSILEGLIKVQSAMDSDSAQTTKWCDGTGKITN